MAYTSAVVPNLVPYWEDYMATTRDLAMACFYAWTLTPSPNDDNTFQVCRTQRTKIGKPRYEPKPCLTLPKTHVELARQFYSSWNTYVHAYAVDPTWTVSEEGTDVELTAFKRALNHMEAMLMVFCRIHVAIVNYYTRPSRLKYASPLLAWAAYHLFQIHFEHPFDAELVPQWLHYLHLHPDLEGFGMYFFHSSFADHSFSFYSQTGMHGPKTTMPGTCSSAPTERKRQPSVSSRLI